MKEWVKVWTDILGDFKLLRAARGGAKGLDLLPWLFVFAKQANDGGRLTVNGQPVEPEDLSHLIPCTTPARFAACLASLHQLAVLVSDPDGALRFAAWEERQSKPSDSKEAVAERMRRYRARKHGAGDTPPDVTVTPVTRNGVSPSYATEGEGEEREKKNPTPPAPLRGADAPSVAVVVHSLNGNGHHPNGNGNGNGKPKRGLPAVQERGRRAIADLIALSEREAAVEEQRGAMVALVFSYWAAKTKHTNALQDPKRSGLIGQRLTENRFDVNELLYVVDGCLKDRNCQGQNERNQKYDGIETVFRDRAQVEKFSGLAKYAPGKVHPMVEQVMAGVTNGNGVHP